MLLFKLLSWFPQVPLIGYHASTLWRMKGILLITALGQQGQTGTFLDKLGFVVSPPQSPAIAQGPVYALAPRGSCHSGASLGQDLGGFEVRVPD